MDKMIKNVILLRHGKTVGNLEKRYIGSRTDISLSEEGVREIELAAPEIREMAGESFYLVSSPMKRAHETAGLIFPQNKIHTNPKLREIDFGDFEGKNYEELKENPEYIRWIESSGTLPFPNGERRDEFIERSLEGFMESLAGSDKAEKLIIVCHGGNIMGIMSSITGKDYFDFMTGNMGGYSLTLTMENERIVDISYFSINP